MKKIKETILLKAKELFNDRGTANVSIREIARALGISHSNLIYHFKDKNTLIDVLHRQILERAIALNQEVVKEKNVLKGLFFSTVKGFEVLQEYRFFMVDFNYILSQNQTLHQEILKIEVLRNTMYQDRIDVLIADKIMRKSLFPDEYTNLINQIRVFSDYWLSSAQVYETDPKTSTAKYAKLFLFLFYPYLTEKGRLDFYDLLEAFNL